MKQFFRVFRTAVTNFFKATCLTPGVWTKVYSLASNYWYVNPPQIVLLFVLNGFVARVCTTVHRPTVMQFNWPNRISKQH